MNFKYCKATKNDLEKLWKKNILDNPNDKRWIDWKVEAINNNEKSLASTYTILCDGEPIGEGTLIFSPQCSAIHNRKQLADNFKTANINALRIQKKYEGQGHISHLMNIIEKEARFMGYTYLTIGVEAQETRNLGIYIHWGYDRFVFSEIEDGNLVLYYKKKLK